MRRVVAMPPECGTRSDSPTFFIVISLKTVEEADRYYARALASSIKRGFPEENDESRRLKLRTKRNALATETDEGAKARLQAEIAQLEATAEDEGLLGCPLRSQEGRRMSPLQKRGRLLGSRATRRRDCLAGGTPAGGSVLRLSLSVRARGGAGRTGGRPGGQVGLALLAR